ncbi:MAG: hypothetical protein M3Y59_13810 [Myxococcota bacterium]|nr:hypothetical protein [Myxococcota bacterium]
MKGLPWGLLAGALSLVSLAAEPSFVAEPAAPVLGRTDRVRLTFQVPGQDTQQLRVAVNVGTLSTPNRVGAGRYTATYTPPPTRFPQAALLLAWQDGPGAEVAFYRLPLLGTTRLPVSTNPNTEVRVRVAEAVFGPVQTDAQGEATIPLDVPPGVVEAEVLVGGAKTGRKVALEVPPYNRLVAAAVPARLVTDGSQEGRIDVYFESLANDPVRPTDVLVIPSVGTVTPIDSSASRIRYRYLPPRMTGATEAQVAVTLKRRAASATETRVELSQPEAQTVKLSVSPGTLRLGSGRTAAIEARVRDARGGPVPGRKVLLRAGGAPVGPMRDLGDGSYRLEYAGPSTVPPPEAVELVARVEGGPTAAPAKLRLEVSSDPVTATIRFTPDPLPPEGGAAATLEIRLFDLARRPTTHSSLKVVASHGTVSGVRPLKDGRWVARYTAPARLPLGGDTVTVSDGTLTSAQRVPLGAADYRFAVGVLGGFTHSLGETFSPTLAVDAWIPLRVANLSLGAGAVVHLAGATQRFSGNGPPVEGSALWFPLYLRGGYELSFGASTFQAGLQFGVAPARLGNALTGETQWVVGLGGGLFGTVTLPIGQGQLVGDLGLATLPLQGRDFTVQGAGLSLRVGYRFAIQ